MLFGASLFNKIESQGDTTTYQYSNFFIKKQYPIPELYICKKLINLEYLKSDSPKKRR
ncbi:hypothetical protein PL9214290166 [Planktothrix tepida PCC 9214]|uniref:Uncharacterized protein n=1 Tax=Planktothrix tepida PCC 9214 TaxID=671072 RepID=A0A1J1LDT8_9CYAN|nr:hypothetical protein PL9214290166 [Planktothrix tepida PCC 9214]